jgi:hypothetical protein
LVDVEARSWPGRVVTVLSDEAVEGADAETLLTTEDTIERSTRMQVSHGVYRDHSTEPVVLLTLLLQGVQPGLCSCLLVKISIVQISSVV